MRALTTTLLAAMLPLVAATLLLGAYLNYASVRTHTVAIVGDRLETAARRVASDAQTALSLGLSLQGQSALERNLRREAAADEAIGMLDVVDDTGVVLFSTDPARIGGPLEPALDPLLSRQSPVVSPFGTVAGVVVARASSAHVNAEIGTLARAIATGTLVAMGVSLLAIAALVVWTVRALWGRIMAQTRTHGGATVPAEIGPTIDALDAAHAAIAKRLDG